MVLIGGWVPYLLLQRHMQRENPFQHVGSIDSDWVIDPSRVNIGQYETIVRSLKRRGFVEDPEIRHRLVKTVVVPESTESIAIAVDFLTEIPPKGKGAGRRHREVQSDLQARTFEAAELALRHSQTMRLQGQILKGGGIEIDVRVADIIGSIGTKGLALGRRYEEKDNYDLYGLIGNYGNGPVEVARLVRPFLGETLLLRGLQNIRTWFRSIEGAGPVAVANFFVTESGVARERRIRDAFEVVDRFLRELGLT
jgi:hypothetical protein